MPRYCTHRVGAHFAAGLGSTVRPRVFEGPGLILKSCQLQMEGRSVQRGVCSMNGTALRQMDARISKFHRRKRGNGLIVRPAGDFRK